MADVNPPVITRFGDPDPDDAPLNVNALVAMLNALVTSEIQGSYIPYVIQFGEPDIDDQNKAWIELTAPAPSGKPKAIKLFYNGRWRRIYNGMLGELRGFWGDPSDYFNENGLGNPGGEYDGWHICNGLGGTPDLSDKFMVGGHMNNADRPGYNSGQQRWQTFVDGVHNLTEGGAKDFQLDAAHTFQPAVDRVAATKWSADGNAPDGGGDLLGKPTGPDENLLIAPRNDGNPNPTPVPTLPPFKAMAWIMFVGY